MPTVAGQGHSVGKDKDLKTAAISIPVSPVPTMGFRAAVLNGNHPNVSSSSKTSSSSMHSGHQSLSPQGIYIYIYIYIYICIYIYIYIYMYICIYVYI
jgi:hypothetical protein